MAATIVTSLRRLKERLRRHPSGEALVQYVDQELDGPFRRDIERHLESCSLCRTSVEEFGSVLRGAIGPGEDTVPPELMAEMLQGILATIGAAPGKEETWTAEGLRDLASCLGTDEAVATRRREPPALAVPRLAALLGTPAATALVERNNAYS